MAEMFMATELARSLMYAAAIKLRDDPGDARAYVAAAKVKADKCARLVAQLAVQLHGGIGTTDEFRVGHYLKHIEVLTQQFGGTQTHVRRYQKLRQTPSVIS
jgi:alkylation response protein AidB-like acyl-CoA dehydrogenase